MTSLNRKLELRRLIQPRGQGVIFGQGNRTFKQIERRYTAQANNDLFNGYQEQETPRFQINNFNDFRNTEAYDRIIKNYGEGAGQDIATYVYLDYVETQRPLNRNEVLDKANALRMASKKIRKLQNQGSNQGGLDYLNNIPKTAGNRLQSVFEIPFSPVIPFTPNLIPASFEDPRALAQRKNKKNFSQERNFSSLFG